MTDTALHGTAYVEPVANDRLKSSFSSWFYGSLMVATLLHFAMIALWPQMEAETFTITESVIDQIELVQEFELPPPPQQISRPAIPVISTNINISDDITIGEVTFNENPVSELPPPPTGTGVATGNEPAFTPTEVRPQLRNGSAIGQQIERRYPTMLKDAGIGGTTTLWIYIGENGEVLETRVYESSGYEQLDQVAEAVIRETAQFSPAMNRDQRVPVWTQLPITFRVDR
jgi:TonB family protein